MKREITLNLQSGDEVWDYTKAQFIYNTHKIIVEYLSNDRKIYK